MCFNKTFNSLCVGDVCNRDNDVRAAIGENVEHLLTDYFSSMCDKVSVLHVVLHLAVCPSTMQDVNPTNTVKDFSVSVYCGRLRTLLFIRLTDDSLTLGGQHQRARHLLRSITGLTSA